MRFVDDQRRASGPAQRGVFRERRLIAVHAEQRFDHHELLPLAGVLAQQPLQRRRIVVRKHHSPRARQPHSVDQARVIPLVRENHIARLPETSSAPPDSPDSRSKNTGSAPSL